MPEVHITAGANPNHRRQGHKQRRPDRRRLGLALLGESSAALPGTATTEHEMLFWVGCFYRLHQRRRRLIPVQLKTMDCPVEKRDGSPLIGSDGRPVCMRCVREVALREARGQITWEVIEYAIGVPGVRFHRCQSLEEAMDRFAAAPEPVRLS